MHSNPPSPSPKSRFSPLLVVATLAAAALLAKPAAAEELYTFTIAALGGVGGSFDADPGDGLGNTGFQLNLAMVTQARTHLVLRAGQVGLGDGELFADLVDADMTYVTAAGEYRYRHSFYESGMFLGLGGYRLSGSAIGSGESREETSVGLTLGATGEFQINRNLSFVIEVAGHYVEFDQAQLFATGHAGISIHF